MAFKLFFSLIQICKEHLNNLSFMFQFNYNSKLIVYYLLVLFNIMKLRLRLPDDSSGPLKIVRNNHNTSYFMIVAYCQNESGRCNFM